MLWAKLQPEDREQVGPSRDRFGWSLLGWAINSGSIEATDYILSLNLPDMDLQSTKPLLLNAAISRGHITLIRHLIDLGVDPNYAPGNLLPPLSAAIRRGLLEVVKTLVEHGKADVHTVDMSGNSTAQIAEKSGHFEVASYLRSIIMADGKISAKEAQQFEATVRWTRPRLIGSPISGRCFPANMIVDNKHLLLCAGRGYPENSFSGVYQDLPVLLFQADLPAKPLPMTPNGSVPMNQRLLNWYRNAESNTTLRVYLDEYGQIGHGPVRHPQEPPKDHQTWSKTYSSSLLKIENGNELKYLPSTVEAPAQAHASKAFVNALGMAYFEITVVSLGLYGYIGIGVADSSEVDSPTHMGWHKSSYGYHADIGCVFHGTGSGVWFSTHWKEGDVIGCGIDFLTAEVFYTQNGVYLGTANRGIAISSPWYAAVSMQSPGEHIKANFGSEPFAFNFIAPTLQFETISPLGSIRHPKPSMDGEMLISVPPSVSSLGIAWLGLHSLELTVLEPIIDKEANPNDPPLTFDELCGRRKKKTLCRWSEPKHLQPHYNQFAISAFVSAYSGPITDSSNTKLGRLDRYSTDTHLFIVSFEKKIQQNNQQEELEAVSLSVVTHVWAIDWSDLGIRRIDLQPITLRATSLGRAAIIERVFDENTLTIWNYCGESAYSISTKDLVACVLDDATVATVAPLEWIVHPTLGPQPNASDTNCTQLLPGLAAVFGGYESTEPVGTLSILDSRDPSKPQWAKPRKEGIVSVGARYFGICASRLIPTSDSSTSTSLQKRTAEHLIPSLAGLKQPGRALDEKFELYVGFGWDGRTTLSDVMVGEITLPATPEAELPLTSLHDLTIDCEDGQVSTSKILAYCRSSYMRKLLTSDHSQSVISLKKAVIKSQVTLIVSAVEEVLAYWNSDRIPVGNFTTEQLAPFLAAIEFLCPEHTAHVNEHLFGECFTQISSLSSDLERCLESPPVIPADLRLISLLEPNHSDSSGVWGYSYIAALRSDFFRAAVLGNFAEATLVHGARTLPIQADTELISLLWEGLCTGTFPNRSEERIIDLFEIALSLQIKGLAGTLEDLISQSIDEENVAMLEEVAEIHYAETLARSCAAFRASSKTDKR